MKCLLLFLVLVISVSAEQIVQCVANFDVDEALYTQVLQERGYPGRLVATNLNDAVAEADKIFFFNLTPDLLHNETFDRLPKEKLVLFLWEPKTVLAYMYAPDVLERFGKVYTWDDGLVDNGKYQKLNYPACAPMIDTVPAFEEKKFCTLMASNLWSGYSAELYSERERAIDYFEGAGETGFEFWGRWWDVNRHPSYRGQATDKIGVIKNYKFSICYENTSDAPGYITEKIFHCFHAGQVPVYLGAPNITDYIPKGCFVDRRDFATMAELHEFLKGMSAEQYEEYLREIRAFLASDAAQQFTFTWYGDRLYQAVVDE